MNNVNDVAYRIYALVALAALVLCDGFVSFVIALV